MRRRIIVLLSILAVVVIGVAAGAIALSSYISSLPDKVNAVTVEDVDLKQIADGTYNGAYNLFPVSVAVKVTVKDHVISAVELVKHTNGKGQAAEVLPARVVEAQSLKVDTVSGATVSSKAILKAIEYALAAANR